MLVDSEMQMGSDLDIVIFAGSIVRWEAPFDAETLATADKRRIRATILERWGT